ncbi:zinc finger protein 761-like [Trichogramma pretiosum]|uniref:zinc finger protein 761-like n=1 Tax=Trichogramma pretiosum TaxID=7493 RepID=UPI000C71B7B0|nr:zinc finger protein 761-like [Trichogramma pretiosum]
MAEESNLNFDGERNNDMEIVFECQDVKPNNNLLLRKKMDLDKIKEEPPEKIKEVVDDMAEESNLNSNGELNNDVAIEFECEDVKPSVDIPVAGRTKIENFIDSREEMNLNCEPVKQNKKKRIMKKSTLQKRLKSQRGTLQIGSTSAHKSRKKKCAQKSKLKIDALHKKLPFECDICKKRYTEKSSVKRHIGKIHMGKKCAQKSKLKAHKNKKTSHACGTCGKTFTHRASLKLHISSRHEGVKHKCGTCGSTFTTKSSLQKHIDALHNGIGPKCELCGKKYSKKDELKRHVEADHYGTTHACDKCNKTFKRKDKLRFHIESIHNNGKKHECRECGKKFATKKEKPFLIIAHSVASWAHDNGLVLNVSKTKAIMFAFDQNLMRVQWDLCSEIVLEGTETPFEDCVKNLGLMMHRSLSWKNHVIMLHFDYRHQSYHWHQTQKTTQLRSAPRAPSGKVKEEPSEVSFDECGDGIMNEPIDHKNVQLLPFRDNLDSKMRRYDD